MPSLKRSRRLDDDGVSSGKPADAPAAGFTAGPPAAAAAGGDAPRRRYADPGRADKVLRTGARAGGA
ncbi:hypothetical protein, partial [Streptomyces sp. NPDC002690]